MNRNLTVSDNGNLLIDGIDATSLAKEYSTPLYVMEENKIRNAMRDYKNSIDKFYDGNGLVCYASKAFSCKEIYRIAKSENLGVDVVSEGELFTALSVNFPAEKIVFHGNNKSKRELLMALNSDVGRIVVDNLSELELLNNLAKKQNKKADILLRIKPGVDAHTHSFIMTGQIDSKFGFALETGEAMDAVKKALSYENINLSGVHCHIGSQIFDTEPFVTTANIMMKFILDIKNETDFIVKDLNLGGGFGIKYTDDDNPIPYENYMEKVSVVIKEKSEEYSLPCPFIIIEPGRSIVGEAGTTLYTVGSVKEIPDIRTYVSVDGGMYENPRVALYQAEYDMVLANRVNDSVDGKFTIAGKCCESGDLLGENIPLPTPKSGDILAVFSTGAYHYSMSSHYNRNLTPPVIMVKDGKSRVIVKGESLEELIRNDI